MKVALYSLDRMVDSGETALGSGRRVDCRLSPQVLVLSTDHSRTRHFIQCVQELRLGARAAASLSEVHRLCTIAGTVLLLDADFFDSPARDVFDVSAALSVPVIVIVSRFDTPKWINLIKKGASEVLRDPVSAQDLQTSIFRVLPQLQWKLAGKSTGWLERTLRAGQGASWHMNRRWTAMNEPTVHQPEEMTMKTPWERPVRLGAKIILAIGFGGLLSLLVFLGLHAVQALDRVRKAEGESSQTYLVRHDRLEAVRAAAYAASSQVRNYLVDPDSDSFMRHRVPALADRSRAETAVLRYRQVAAPERLPLAGAAFIGPACVLVRRGPEFRLDRREKAHLRL